MAKMRVSITQASTNFSSSGGKASTNYAAAIPKADAITPGTSQQAQANYVARMTDPATLAKRLTNLSKVSVQTWRDMAIKKGVPNINIGITNAGPKWSTNFTPFYNYIASFQLHPKTTNSDTNIDNNLKPLARGLQAIARGQTLVA